ncbi:DNA (cytosine-5-)-methyltransferase [Psychrobacter sp. SCQQ22]|uniref:DNA (cytosine-5-)-methyltransferase n=2 Tax=Gammaproteobacteria TaxID=1236 RepID=UPI0018CE4275|nr:MULTISPECIES: DNA (cytosine-5-)-methyltransferase [Psychrobacter]MBH0085062.1 DNA (cytosine-5-)-methyltransferase [Psychrobacter sp. SCQQ22]
MIRFIDLFAGTGGIRLGFEQALHELNINSECVLSAEIDKEACKTYEENFGENPYCDITQLSNVKDFDVLLAGFPCQAFSSAGKRLGFEDTRGTLFFDVARLIESNQPSLCILENVRGLVNHNKGKTFATIKNVLIDLGYKFEYRLLNSSNYSVAQNRVRIYIVAVKGIIPKITLPSDVGAVDSHAFKENLINNDLFHDNKSILVRDILEPNPSSHYNCSEEFTDQLKKVLKGDLSKLHGIRLIDSRGGNSIHSWDLGLRGECNNHEIEFMDLLIANRRKNIFGTHQDGKALSKEQISTFYLHDDIDSIINSLLLKRYIKEKDGLYNLVAGNMSFEVFKFLDPDSISITLTASDSNRLGIYHNERVRRLTPRECARLQGFPDSYKLHPKDNFAYKQLGNAVSVPVIKALVKDVLINNPNLLK